MADLTESTAVTADGPSSTPSEAPSSTPAEASPSTQSTQVEQGTQSKETLLDAVLKVVPTTPETDVLAKTPDSDDPKSQTPTSEGKAEDTSDTEDDGTQDDDSVPPETSPVARKKINRLLRQRRELRDTVSAMTPDATVGREIANFASTNGLNAQDVSFALSMAAAINRRDYEMFYSTMSPFIRRAQEELGLVLPPDLEERVRAGHMTEAAAKDFARTRFDGMYADREVQRSQVVQQASGLQALQGEIARSVSAMEERFAANDPDYKAKADTVRRTAQALLFENGGTISSVDEALALTKAAYDEVNKRFRSFQPRPRPTNAQPNGHGQTPSARSAPKTLMEAAMQGLANSRSNGSSV